MLHRHGLGLRRAVNIDELRQHIANPVFPAKLLGLLPIHAEYSLLLFRCVVGFQQEPACANISTKLNCGAT